MDQDTHIRLTYLISKVEALESLCSEIYSIRSDINQMKREISLVSNKVSIIECADLDNQQQQSEASIHSSLSLELTAMMNENRRLMEEMRELKEAQELIVFKQNRKLRRLRRRCTVMELELEIHSENKLEFEDRLCSADQQSSRVAVEIETLQNDIHLLDNRVDGVEYEVKKSELRTLGIQEDIDAVEKVLYQLNNNISKMTEKVF
jgi:chromosome segregation ATPase